MSCGTFFFFFFFFPDIYNVQCSLEQIDFKFIHASPHPPITTNESETQENNKDKEDIDQRQGTGRFLARRLGLLLLGQFFCFCFLHLLIKKLVMHINISLLKIQEKSVTNSPNFVNCYFHILVHLSNPNHRSLSLPPPDIDPAKRLING
jgi:hypothetical protein